MTSGNDSKERTMPKFMVMKDHVNSATVWLVDMFELAFEQQ